MRVFVTGASGFIGSAVIPELVREGHHVVGLARSEVSAEALKLAGVEVHRGALEDPETLKAAAASADGVIHLAFIHDFSRYEAAANADTKAIETMGAVLEGTNKPLVIASGLLGLAPGRLGTETDVPAKTPRGRSERVMLGLAERGVRSAIVRLPPSVHGAGDHGFLPHIISMARKHGVSAYVGEGKNRWCAVHRFDAARLFRLALEQAVAGSVLHAVGDEGVRARDIAEVIGRRLSLPVVSKTAEEAPRHWGFLGSLFALDTPISSAITQEKYSWKPTYPGLLEDIAADHYYV